MPRKKAIAKPEHDDVEWEQHEKLLAMVKDIQVFTAVAILVAALSLLILLTVVMPMDEKMNSMSNDVNTLAAGQSTTNYEIYGIEQAINASNQTPFCYGYDATGHKGWGIDVSKIANQCKE